eukprot:m.16497 g.16497  ORF g.16497 m.16497 type:complete len:84 (-) comp8008_c0_seq1:178-429(-)
MMVFTSVIKEMHLLVRRCWRFFHQKKTLLGTFHCGEKFWAHNQTSTSPKNTLTVCLINVFITTERIDETQIIDCERDCTRCLR